MGAFLRFIYRHILRSKGKTLLVALMSLFFVLALSLLQEAILRSEAEIEQLYELTTVRVEIEGAHFAVAWQRLVGNVIKPQTIEQILDTGVTGNEYIEAGHEYVVVIPKIDGALPENWEELTGVDFEEWNWFFISHFIPILGVNNLDLFQIENSRGLLDEIPGSERILADGRLMEDMEIIFASGYGADSFVFSEGELIPVILADSVIEIYDIELGDTVYLAKTFEETHEWTLIEARAIGMHNQNIIRGDFLTASIMPLEALEHLMGEETGYIMLHFEIPTEYSREIDRIREEFTEIMEQPDAGWAELSIIIRDQELRMVAAPMEQTLSILRMLYPVVIGASIVIGLGLAMIFMIQNAKNAAVMRVLGGTKLKTRIALTTEQLLICMLGLFVGLVVLIITGWGFGLASSLMLMGLYVIGVFIGAVTGAVLVTNRPALDLLQVRE